MTGEKAVVVVGAGIAGLTIAWELCGRGAKVTVLEAGAPGCGATSAAAAYLQDTPDGLAISGFSRTAIEMWPGFARRVERESGRDIDYQTHGALAVARNGDLAHLDKAFMTGGGQARRLTPLEARMKEPGLAGDLTGAVFNPGISWVDPGRLVASLVRVLEEADVEIRPDSEVEQVMITDNLVAGVRIRGGREIKAARVVIAGGLPAGFKTTRLTGAGWRHPATRPVKGELLALQADPDNMPVHHLILRPAGGIVPRRNGRIIIGATTKQNIADPEVSITDTDALLADAVRFVPALAELPVVARWAGLRPYGADGLPLIGETPVRGLYLINGLGAHGVKLAPAAAAAVADLITSGETTLPIERFVPQRI